MKIEVKKSVRELVEMILKSGSLDNRFKTNARAIEGVKAHQKLQKSNMELFKNYEKEVYLKTSIDLGSFTLVLEGRCDGIIIDGSDVIVEEIKSTYVPLVKINEDFNKMHWSQGKIYAYMLCKERKIDSIYVQLSYYNLENDEVKSFLKKYEYNYLIEYIEELTKELTKYIELEINRRENRNSSIKKIKFPYEDYREGQLGLIKSCYGTIRDEKKLFLQAPTGTGKTISTIYAAIKAIGMGLAEKIFYLTAKNVNRKVAEETLNELKLRGLKVKTLSLVAKEKMCLNDKIACNEEECIYAQNYYDKLNKYTLEILNERDEYTLDNLKDYGEKYKMCPFELGLDIIEWCDISICDYNYIFDPKVYLRRIVDERGKETIVLVDEAHNLIDRARSSYSSTLEKSKFLNAKKVTRGILPKLYKHINNINKVFIEERQECQERQIKARVDKEFPKEMCKKLRILNKELEEVFAQKQILSFNDLLLDIYFQVNNFLNIVQLYDENYVTYINTYGSEVIMSLFCVNPAVQLKNTMDKFKAVILFSATLSPFEYFINILGGSVNDYRLKLNSPFSKENLRVYLYKCSTRYKDREITLEDICRKIFAFINEEKGNYLVFLPSYEYMNGVKSYIEKNINLENILFQEGNMDEEQKNQFIKQFTEDSNVIGICVIGGMFSEGIDLPGKRLIGVILVGVGYPKISLENNIIRDYFKKHGEKIAYIYPGLNKVMQAVGRVIRTENDRGRVLLIDDRYNKKQYYDMLPDEWKPFKEIK